MKAQGKVLKKQKILIKNSDFPSNPIVDPRRFPLFNPDFEKKEKKINDPSESVPKINPKTDDENDIYLKNPSFVKRI